MNIKDSWYFNRRNEQDIRLECTVCGASTEDEEAIKQTKNNICPICFSFGSLTIKKKGESK